jgi:hypothetical protein
LFPELFRHSKRKNRTVADALTSNTWVRDIDHDMSQRIIEEYLQLWDKLEHVVLTQSDEDRIIWTHSSSGEYSAKSAYDLHFHNLDRCSVAELIWKTRHPKMPVLHLVAPPGQVMDSSKAAGEALAERVFLPALHS